MRQTQLPPPSDIGDYLSYDATSGVFTWVKKPNDRIHAGAVAGSLTRDGYARVYFRGIEYRAHTLALYFATGEWVPMVDHRNLVKADNRLVNLRPATPVQNQVNKAKQPGCSSRFKGVTLLKNGRWLAQIKVGDRKLRLGSFDTEVEASTAYMVVARDAYGEFARAE